MSVKSKFPRPLKRLDASDLLTIKDENEDYYVVTKQETAKVIRDFVINEIGNLPDEISEKHKIQILDELNKKMLGIEKLINNRLSDIEKEMAAFIDFKFDTLAEKASELLINRKFIEEVNKKTEQKLLEKNK
jgi:hypothetical protein